MQWHKRPRQTFGQPYIFESGDSGKALCSSAHHWTYSICEVNFRVNLPNNIAVFSMSVNHLPCVTSVTNSGGPFSGNGMVRINIFKQRLSNRLRNNIISILRTYKTLMCTKIPAEDKLASLRSATATASPLGARNAQMLRTLPKSAYF